MPQDVLSDSVRPILLWPDPRLRQKALKIGPKEWETMDTWSEVLENSCLWHKAVGLAAPQIGIPYRMIALDWVSLGLNSNYKLIINPVIQWVSQSRSTQTEGCLSLPKQSWAVMRPTHLHLQWQTPNKRWHEKTFKGFAARCLQHEIDHLDGILLPDHVHDQAFSPAPPINHPVVARWNPQIFPWGWKA